MKGIRLKHLTPLIGLILFGLAIYVLNRSLGEHSYGEILRQLSELSPRRISAAIGLTALTYFILTLYDHLALNYLGQPLGKFRVSVASFISYSFSRNIGLSILTGGSIRYRFYSSWGLAAEKVARLVTFAVLGFTLGMMTMGGTITLISPISLSNIPYVPLWVLRPAGGLAVAAVISYLLLVFFRRKPVRIRGRYFPLPSPRHALGQIAIGSLDWTLTASVLYYLMAGKAPLSLLEFLQIYLIAQVAVIISHVPAGLGVFESVILFLVPGMEAPELLGILLVYRAIYFLLPFGTAILLMGAMEAIQHRRHFGRAKDFMGSRFSALAPPVLSGAVLIAGSIMLFTAATPAIPERMERLGFLPLPVIELSHFLAALTGTALLLTARGLQLRLLKAYKISLLLLGGGIIFSLLKGLTYEQAVVLAVVAAALAPSRDLFFRRTSLLEEPITIGWATLILIILGAFAWLLLFSHKGIDLSSGLWWRFDYGADAPRSLRAAIGAVILLIGFFAAKILHPSSPDPALPTPRELEKAHSIAEKQPSAHAFLALLGDKRLLFSTSGNAFLMYHGRGENHVALGEPVGATAQVRELAWDFREMCERHESWPVFLDIGDKNRDIHLDMGLVLEKIGEQASTRLSELPPEFCLPEVTVEMSRYCFEVAPPEKVVKIIPDLKRVSDDWPRDHKIPDPIFFRSWFHPDFLSRFPLALVHHEGQIVAFANLLSTRGKEELVADLVKFAPDMPGILEYLLGRTMKWGQEQGFRNFNLGMAPCCEKECELSSALWKMMGSGIYRYGEFFPDPLELRTFKERFHPNWTPRYMAFPGGVSLSEILAVMSELCRDKRPPEVAIGQVRPRQSVN